MKRRVLTKKKKKEIDDLIGEMVEKFRCVNCEKMVIMGEKPKFVIDKNKTYCPDCYNKLKLKRIKDILK